MNNQIEIPIEFLILCSFWIAFCIYIIIYWLSKLVFIYVDYRIEKDETFTKRRT